jgi:hypothetical protein
MIVPVPGLEFLGNLKNNMAKFGGWVAWWQGGGRVVAGPGHMHRPFAKKRQLVAGNVVAKVFLLPSSAFNMPYRSLDLPRRPGSTTRHLVRRSGPATRRSSQVPKYRFKPDGTKQVKAPRRHLGLARLLPDGSFESVYPRRSKRLQARRLPAPVQAPAPVQEPAPVQAPRILVIHEMSPPVSADSKKKSLGEFFGKVVRKATPPVSTIEEDSDTSDSDDDFDYEDSCDCCVKGWSKANEFGRCVCRCSCRKLLRNCRYECKEFEEECRLSAERMKAVKSPPVSADSKKKSLGEFFGKVVRKATPPVSTIEEDSDTSEDSDSSDSDGVIDPFSFCQPPTCDDE